MFNLRRPTLRINLLLLLIKYKSFIIIGSKFILKSGKCLGLNRLLILA